MEVDEVNRKRARNRDDEGQDQVFQDVRQGTEDDETPVPTEQVPPAPLGMGDLFRLLQQNMAETQKGREENKAGFHKLEKDIASTKRDLQDTKELAAKATTIANETPNSLAALEKRVQKLEQLR